MRVLVVAAWPSWPLSDGARLILHHHLRALAGRHDLTVLAAGRHPGDEVPPDAVPPSVDLRWFGAGRTGVTEYARRRLASLLSGEPADVFRVEVPGLVDAYERALAHHPPDVVHLMGSGTARLAHRARAAGIPVVHMPIDAWRTAYGTHVLKPAWRRAIERGQRRKVRRHERRHLPACASVVVVAEGDAAVLRQALPGTRVEVVPNGIAPGPDPVTGRRDAGPVVGIHGAMSTVPNRTAAIALATEVLPLLQRAVPDARARIIGRDPAPDVQRLAGPVVEVTGAVPDVRTELERLAVYVVPMRTGSGLKNKVLEAMAAGLPVVATPLALDGIGPGPGVVVGASSDELARAAARLLDDGDERDRMGAAARRRVVDGFRWEDSARAIERLWVEAAGTVSA